MTSASLSCLTDEEKGPREGKSSAQGHIALIGQDCTGTSRVLSGSSAAVLPLSLTRFQESEAPASQGDERYTCYLGRYLLRASAACLNAPLQALCPQIQAAVVSL